MGVRILVVEDEPRLSAFIEKGLSQRGMTVSIAWEGSQALQHLRAEHFDLVLLDLGLPGLDGWQVLEQIQQEPDPPPTLIMTARVNTLTQVERLNVSVAGILLKPFRFTDLLSRIDQILQIPPGQPHSGSSLNGNLMN